MAYIAPADRYRVYWRDDKENSGYDMIQTYEEAELSTELFAASNPGVEYCFAPSGMMLDKAFEWSRSAKARRNLI